MSISPFTRRVLTVLGLALAVCLLLLFVWYAAQGLLLLFASGLVAIFLSGVSGWLREKTGIRYGRSLLLVVCALLIIAGGLAAFLTQQLVQQARQLYQGLAESWQQTRDWIQQFAWGEQLLDQAEQDTSLVEQVGPAIEVLGMIGAVVGGAIVIAVIGLYLASSPDLYKKGLLRLVPVAKRRRALEVAEAVGQALRGWLLAQFVSMAVIGTLVAVGLMLFGIELWLILGVLAGLLTFIPNLGPIIAAVPPVVIALNQSPALALGVVAYFTAVQMLEGYWVTPMVQNHVIRLPPAGILAAQLLMAYSLGLLGVALAAPLLAAAMVVVEMLYVQDVLEDREIRITGQRN